jgi:predicted nucleic acid-binding protein
MIKNKIKDEIIQKKLKVISENVTVSDISMGVVKRCWNIRKRYKYSYYDSLILASALENNCSVIYTEDMQSG